MGHPKPVGRLAHTERARWAGPVIQTSRTGIAFGNGYRYLTKTVAAGDGDLKAADALMRYYDAHGTPPGRWLGSGLAGLGDGEL